MSFSNALNQNGTGIITSDGDGTYTYSTTTDNRILRGDTANNLQDSGVSIDDSNNISGGTWQGTAVAATYGGTGQNTSASTGVAQVSSGTWSVSTALADGTTATTQSSNDNSTKVATTAYVDAAAGGGGAWTYISSATASASASLTFTSGIDSTYNVYMFTFDYILPATDQVYLSCRTSTDAGSTWDSGASDYSYESMYVAGAVGVNSSAGTGTVILTGGGAAGNNPGNASNEGIVGRFFLYNPSDITHYKLLEGNFTWSSSVSNNISAFASMTRESTGDIDGVQFFMSSGNISSGTIRMYGLTKS